MHEPFFLTRCPLYGYGSTPGLGGAERGNRRWTGATPFLLSGSGMAVLRKSHLRRTPWEGRSRPKNPCGKATERGGSTDRIGLQVLTLVGHGNSPCPPSVGASARTGLWPGPRLRSNLSRESIHAFERRDNYSSSPWQKP